MSRAKRVLVTGGAGFIPSNFIRHILQATPFEVVSLDALTYAGSMDNLAPVSAHERHSFAHGDIRDMELVRKVVWMGDVLELLLQQFLLTVANEVAERVVNLDELTVRCLERHTDRCVIEGAPEALFAFP